MSPLLSVPFKTHLAGRGECFALFSVLGLDSVGESFTSVDKEHQLTGV